MTKISKNKMGLVFGVFFGVSHLAWALLVLAGLAQPYMDWIFRLHFIQPPYTITPFNFVTAILLVAVTTVIGYLFGWLFGVIWNWMCSSE